MTATVADTDTVTVAAGNGKVPSATPTDMFALDSRVRGNDGAVADAATATDDNRAAVVGTVATTTDSIGDGAVATVGITDTVTNPDDETIATDGNHLKSSFPRTRESRTKNSAQPPEFNAGVGDTVTVASDETIVANSKKVSSSYRQDAGIQTQGQQVRAKHGRRRRTPVTTTAVDNCRPWTTGFRRPAGMTSHSDAAVADTVATVGGVVGNRAAVAANGKVPLASPTDMLSLDSRVRGNDGAVVVGGGATDNDDAVVVVTVAGGGDGVGDGAAVTNPGDETIATGGVQNKIVIPAGSGNPDARTAIQIEARSWTADAGGDGATRPPPAISLTAPSAQPTTTAADITTGTVGSTHNVAGTVAIVGATYDTAATHNRTTTAPFATTTDTVAGDAIATNP